MKRLTLFVLILFFLEVQMTPLFAKGGAEGSGEKKPQTVSRPGLKEAYQAPAEFFTGTALVEGIVTPTAPSRNSIAYVSFEPGARSNWHTHKAGQTLIVISGMAWTGEWDGDVYEARTGDVIHCPPGVKHWHGAAADSPMIHVAISEDTVTWQEPVTDDQYADAGRRIREAVNASMAQNTSALSAKQRSIVTISAFTASGETGRLKTALNEGLDAGLTVNEIKEVLIQLYAYSGFPRSLNGINAFSGVIKARESRGIKDETGAEPQALPPDADRYQTGRENLAELTGQPIDAPPAGYAVFVPVIEVFLKEHLFADIFARGVLNNQERELATISALSNIPGVNAQLQSHIGVAMNTGLTEAQIRSFIAVLAARVGQTQANNAEAVLERILAVRK
ncbi:MAG: carboxymuconolactone decarboxylase family protein [Treponema sp.]|nr:carboxymuconolactone decarboxylase family protein [Treponema sp.]